MFEATLSIINAHRSGNGILFTSHYVSLLCSQCIVPASYAWAYIGHLSIPSGVGYQLEYKWYRLQTHFDWYNAKTHQDKEDSVITSRKSMYEGLVAVQIVYLAKGRCQFTYRRKYLDPFSGFTALQLQLIICFELGETIIDR